MVRLLHHILKLYFVKIILSRLLILAVLASLPLQAAQSSKGFLLVANKGDQTMGIIDSDAGRQIATVAENGVTGHELVASPDGKLAFVPIFGNAGVGKCRIFRQLS